MSEPHEPPCAPVGSVGWRLARQRRLWGLGETQLAVRAEVNPTLIARVERGEVPASAAFTAAVARALGVEVTALYGQPYGQAISGPDAPQAVIPALRAALDRDPDGEAPPLRSLPSLVELRAQLDNCGQLKARARYAQLGAALPELLNRLHGLDADPAAERLLTDAYLLAQTAAYRFGYLDLAMLANWQARRAATRCGDRLRVALAAHEHGLLRLHRGDYFGVLLICDRADTEIADETSPAADAVRGALQLREALAHARLGSADRAEKHLGIAAELGEPAVDMSRVSVAVELDDPVTALERARQVTIPLEAEPARVGRYYIDLARAFALRGDHDHALDALRHARTAVGQLVRYHPQARETLHFLTETARRAPDTLAGFARWAAITD